MLERLFRNEPGRGRNSGAPRSRRPAVARLVFAAFLLACAQTMAASRVDATEVDLELVLAVDISGSIDAQEAQLQREGYIKALLHPIILEAIGYGPLGRIAVIYVEWAGDYHQQVVVDWHLIADEADAREFTDKLAAEPIMVQAWTSISAAIDFSASLFDDNGYAGRRRVIDVSGDGYNNRGRLVADARDDAVAAGIVINGLPIINDRPSPWGSMPPRDLDAYYQHNVIGGPGAFFIVAESFTDFARAVRSKLLREIAGPVPPETYAMLPLEDE